MSALRRAEGLLAGDGGGESIRRQVQSGGLTWSRWPGWRRSCLQHARKDRSTLARAVDEAYARAFAELGIDIDRMSVEQAAGLIRLAAHPAPFLAGALDDWADKRHDLGVRRSGRDKSPAGNARWTSGPGRGPGPSATGSVWPWRAGLGELDRLRERSGVGRLAIQLPAAAHPASVFWGTVPRRASNGRWPCSRRRCPDAPRQFLAEFHA